jgi:DNA-binding transcriptional LysR family regulator
MNTSQINCFLAAAECLNFTKAAERMYLSQPGLSRQIAAMEREIGIELFERGKNPVKLTAAGAICAEYLERIRGEYQKMLNEATMAQRIEHDSLNIGGIEGQLVGQCYENALLYFWSTHENIKIKMCFFSVSDLCRALVEGEVDVAIMPEAEAERLPGVLFTRSHMEKMLPRRSRNHPKADAENRRFRISRTKPSWCSRKANRKLSRDSTGKSCRAAGFTPSSASYPPFGTLAMLLEMGGRHIGSRRLWHSLRNAPHLKFIHVPEIGYQIEAVAWRKDNKNPNIPIFLTGLNAASNRPR